MTEVVSINEENSVLFLTQCIDEDIFMTINDIILYDKHNFSSLVISYRISSESPAWITCLLPLRLNSESISKNN